MNIIEDLSQKQSKRRKIVRQPISKVQHLAFNKKYKEQIAEAQRQQEQQDLIDQQEEQIQQQEEAIIYLQETISNLQDEIASLDEQREIARTSGHTKDVHEFGILRNRKTAELRKAKELSKVATEYVLTKGEAQAEIRAIGTHSENVQRGEKLYQKRVARYKEALKTLKPERFSIPSKMTMVKDLPKDINNSKYLKEHDRINSSKLDWKNSIYNRNANRTDTRKPSSYSIPSDSSSSAKQDSFWQKAKEKILKEGSKGIKLGKHYTYDLAPRVTAKLTTEFDVKSEVRNDKGQLVGVKTQNNQFVKADDWQKKVENRRENIDKWVKNNIYDNIKLNTLGLNDKRVTLQTMRDSSELLTNLFTTQPDQAVKTAQDLYLLGKAYASSPKIAKKVFDWYVTVMSGKEALSSENKPVDRVLYGALAVIPQASDTAKIIKDLYQKTGARFVSPNKVFSKEVIKGGKTFPTTSGADKTLQRFGKTKTSKGKLIGTHATETSFGKETTAKSGWKGRHGVEDTGLYITPKGEGSPYFLNIDKIDDTQVSKLSFNPLKDITKSPSQIDIKFGNIQRIPNNIRTQAIKIYKTQGKTQAYKFINNWYKTAKGEAYIPLRSELGETSEIQAVIKEGTPLKLDLADDTNFISKLKGYDKYTIYKGQVIPLRDFSTAGQKTVGSKGGTKALETIQNIFKKYPSYSSYMKGTGSYYTPYSVLGYLGTQKNKSYINKYNKDYYQKYITESGKKGDYYKYYDKNGKYKYPKKSKPREPKYPYSKYPSPYVYPKSPTPSKYTPKTTHKKILAYLEKFKKTDTTSSGKDLVGFQPVLLDKDNNEYPLGVFASKIEALSEGMIATDETPVDKFIIKKKRTSNLLKGRHSKLSHKFKRRKHTIREKRYYRYDKEGEKKHRSFNWMQYLRNKQH
jgi:hypothetical protein